MVSLDTTTSVPAAGTHAPSEPRASTATAAQQPELGLAWCFLAVPISVGLALAGLVIAGRADGPTPTQLIGAGLTACWAVTGLALGWRRRYERLAPIVLAGAVATGLVCLSQAIISRGGFDQTAFGQTQRDGAAIVLRFTAALLPAFALHMLMSVPDGRLTTQARRRTVSVGYVAAVAVGSATSADLQYMRVWPVAVLWVGALCVGAYGALLRYRLAGSVERRRIQWIGWGVSVCAEAVLVVLALRLLADTPHHPGVVALACTAVIPLAIIAGTLPKLVARVDVLLTHTVAITGLTALILGIYVIVVLGLGRTPEGSERSLLLLSMVAAGLAALLYLPARRWLTERANRLVYGARVAPDETLRTFGQRLTRSIPLDELMLQLSENLRSSMGLVSAEVWTGQAGRYELMSGVPHRQPAPIEIQPKELPVVARAGVSGGTWLEIWVPQLVGASGSSAMRVAPVAHAGMLLGFIVVTRRADGDPYTEAEDTVLTEIARQIGLALHNVQLDTALQASLDELRLRNQELVDSRARIVAAGDSERRKLERNLHDGAQQHLVALAVKLRLARDAVDDDPADAVAMIDEIKGDVQEAIAELRALAHGIFPPLLVSGGLCGALPAAASRAALPTTVSFEAVGRYGNDIEAAVYFCTLEALQNAGKHAGDNASAAVSVKDSGDALCFEITDDGAGFDLSTGAGDGHGFVNMADRLGAFGGHVDVTSARGEGTTVIGFIPLTKD